MIKSLDISKFGIFNNFQWKSDFKDQEFKKINIIYGRNYSGKTTLSRIIKCLESKSLPDNYNNVKFSIKFEDSTIDESNITQELNSIIRVYNSDFIKEKLSWLHNPDTGEIEPFVLLGEISIDHQNKINDIKNKLDENQTEGIIRKKKNLESTVSGKQQFLLRLDKQKQTSLEEEARNIKLNTKLYNSPVYTKANLLNDIAKVKKSSYIPIDSDKRVLLKDKTKIENLKLLNQIPTPSLLFKTYSDCAILLCEKIITPSIIIQNLNSNSELQDWVRAGVKLHRNKLDKCAFCDNNITNLRWDELDKHFTHESEQLKDNIMKKIGEVQLYIENFKINTLNYEDFDVELKITAKQLADELNSLRDKYISQFEHLLECLNIKLKNLFTKVQITTIEDSSDNITNKINDLNNLVREHNSKSTTLEQRIKEAHNELRLDEVYRFMDKIDYTKKEDELKALESDIDFSKKQLEELELEISSLNDELKNLQSRSSSEEKAFSLINYYLKAYFKHNNIQISAEDSSLRFIVKRNNKVAHNLSEGERSLISFCYFIARLKDDIENKKNSNDPSKLIIWIDDPISSLDSNNIFFMFALIESVISESNKFKQLFLSTHNLEFLKYLGKLKHVRYDHNKKKEKQLVEYFITERVDENNSTISLMPDYLKIYFTEFNYLFNQIYICQKNSSTISIDAKYNFGNNLRKFLEAYLYFKYPSHKLSYDGRLSRFFSDITEEAAVRRITNEYSHLNDNFDRGSEPIDVDEIQRISKIVINKIESIDREQYASLLESIPN